MKSLLFVLIGLAGMVVGGCAKVSAQSVGVIEDDSCAVGDGHAGHWRRVACIADIGKQPQWVSGATREVPCPTESGTYFGTGVTCTQPGPDHWECEKGFVLDGAKITWPDGVARIEPERCKAEAK